MVTVTKHPVGINMQNWYEIYTFLSIKYGPQEYKRVSPILSIFVKLDLAKPKDGDMWDNIEDLFA
jgi:hypothetical protein